jgi:hypothetical protein
MLKNKKPVDKKFDQIGYHITSKAISKMGIGFYWTY